MAATLGPKLNVWDGWPSGTKRPPEEIPGNAARKDLPKLPSDWYYERDRYWSCDDHTSNVNQDCCYECGHQYEPQCEKCEFGKYITTGPYRLKQKGWMDKILQIHYLPAITKALNEPLFLNTLLGEKYDKQLTLDIDPNEEEDGGW